MIKGINRRQFNRVEFKKPIQASIELITLSFNSDFKTSGEKDIYVIDMSASGLKFASKFEFTVNFLSMYRIKLKLSNKDLVLYGKIIRKRNLVNQFFVYGINFNFSYSEEKE